MSLVLTGIWGTVGTGSALYSAFCFDYMGRRKTMVRQHIVMTRKEHLAN